MIRVSRARPSDCRGKIAPVDFERRRDGGDIWQQPSMLHFSVSPLERDSLAF
jgi:hypothetical protein